MELIVDARAIQEAAGLFAPRRGGAAGGVQDHPRLT